MITYPAAASTQKLYVSSCPILNCIPFILFTFGVLTLTSGCNDRAKRTASDGGQLQSQHKPDPIKHDKLAIHVDGNRLRNDSGDVVQLRGVGLMGMEYTAVGGWNPGNPFPTVVESTWMALRNWRINAIRISLNETSYLGLKCVAPFTGPAYDKPGIIIDADPGHNYKAKLKEVINRATQEGLYIILDLHTTAPDDALNSVDSITTQCATDYNPLPDKDHSIDLWREVATAYKVYPNVMFELFNNPYIDQWKYFKGNNLDAWKALRDGTLVNSYLPLWPTKKSHLWKSAGMQEIVDAVRSTGARNVILTGGISRSSDLEHWVTYKTKDPINQIAAAWHAFPSKNTKWGDKCYPHPGDWCDDRAYTHAANITASGFPVIVSEFGDKNASGTIGAPFATKLLPQLDTMGISYLGWSFTVSGWPDNRLISDNDGTPSDGYGQYVQAHYLCRSTNSDSCDDIEKKISPHPIYFKQQSSQSTTRTWTPAPPPM